MRIGILAVQGAFAEHEHVLRKLGTDYFEIRKKGDLDAEMNGLILPGGESKVMGKLLEELELFNDLKEKITRGLPVLGTCAGAILLAGEIEGSCKAYFGTIPMKIRRNAYGRQLGSFAVKEKIEGIGTYPMRFIRAPYIISIAPSVKILSVVGGNIVAVEYENQLALAFHPELTGDFRVHEHFLDRCKSYIC